MISIEENIHRSCPLFTEKCLHTTAHDCIWTNLSQIYIRELFDVKVRDLMNKVNVKKVYIKGQRKKNMVILCQICKTTQ